MANEHIMGNLMTSVDRPGEKGKWRHRSRFIIHTVNGMWHVADFQTETQLQLFAKTLGFSYTLIDERDHHVFGKIREYRLDRKICDASHIPFRSLKEIPEIAKPIKALSNGSIVTCYFTNDGETIRIYRPNSNCPEIHQPLPLNEHISHHKKFGIY